MLAANRSLVSAMLLLLIALLAQDRPVLPAPDDDALRVVPREKCQADGEEIVVCARTGESPYRISRLEPRFTEKPVRPSLKLPGGASATLHAEQRSLPGASAPAAFVTLKIPIGGKKKSKE